MGSRDCKEMNSLENLLSINHCDMNEFLELTHKTMMLFILEEICRAIKTDNLRDQIIREYQKSLNEDRVTRKLVRDYCAIDLPDNDLKLMTLWLKNFLTRSATRSSVSKETKIALLEKQSYKCICCGTNIDLANSHYDHDIPWTFVGDGLDGNYQMLCSYCNEHKSSRPYYMFKRKLIRKNN